LESVDKQFDPECLECHVTGFQRGGFVSSEATPHLAGVQCEICHGPAREHQADPAQSKFPSARGPAGAHPGEETCRTCHRGNHSPGFSFADYWPRIQHSSPALAR
jgi:hypothetical protein